MNVARAGELFSSGSIGQRGGETAVGAGIRKESAIRGRSDGDSKGRGFRGIHPDVGNIHTLAAQCASEPRAVVAHEPEQTGARTQPGEP